MADETRKAYESGGFRPTLVTPDAGQKGDNGEFALRPLRIQSQGAIPHRQWLYGNHVIRGYVSLLVAPGGTGKSSLLLAMSLAMVTGRPLLGIKVHQQCNAALLNLEDPQDEIDRRLTALAIHYGLTDDDIGGRLFASPPERVVTIAGIGDDGFSVVHPDEKVIIERVRDENIGFLGVDPFAESHTLEENSNPAMIKAAAAWRRVARAGNCGVILAHHVRKGQIESIEAARGAKALTDSARIGLLLSSMSEEEASELGVDPDDRLQFVRLDDAKANMSARAPKAFWFRLVSVTLDNATTTYPFGDQVGVIEAWKPTSAFEAITILDANAVLDRIDEGLSDGRRFTHSKRGGGERWAGHLLVKICGISEGQATSVLKTWMRNEVLVSEESRDPTQRKTRSGLYVNASKRPGNTL